MKVYHYHLENQMHREVRPSLRNGQLRLGEGMNLRSRLKEATSSQLTAERDNEFTAERGNNIEEQEAEVEVEVARGDEVYV